MGWPKCIKTSVSVFNTGINISVRTDFCYRTPGHCADILQVHSEFVGIFDLGKD